MQDNQVVGIGSGSTIEYAIRRLNERVINENLKTICIPSSYQALRSLQSFESLQISTLDRNPEAYVAIDGADEVDGDMNLIKGGGGCLTQEKIVISCAKKVVIIADYRKDVQKFGQSFNFIPIEVIPMAQRPVLEKISKMFGGKPVLREAKQKAGPLVTDNGNFIIDWFFDKDKDYDWNEVNISLSLIPGIVETGLFIQTAHKVFFGAADGNVTSRGNDKL
ncbi:hypothetical protein HELRODRAFT_76235 [Helobdella robusta]|uniref:ribose-5-phosphate isomerase n=1 Tax=Helobdella robusta TaxID=6412 RepID=T1G2H1_HELRO|nr:hypothetical protein HELRODRAFT_76235 [Helobdella robusta]ESO07692.1 hypothetical protein HELRODRAFT_76235 [Helobdella robusta]